MVASVSALTSSAQAASYYEADDYYSEGGLSPSEWQGAGAEALGLSGEVGGIAFVGARYRAAVRPGRQA